MHAGEVRTGDREAPRPAAGRDEQRVIRQHAPVIEPHALLAPQDLLNAPAGLHLDPVLGEELRRAQQQPLALEGARQVLLRERRALVGKPRLIANDGEAPGAALAAQRVGGLHGRLSAPGDHDLPEHGREG